MPFQSWCVFLRDSVVETFYPVYSTLVFVLFILLFGYPVSRDE